jgi:SAM-dependent methyltransferase
MGGMDSQHDAAGTGAGADTAGFDTLRHAARSIYGADAAGYQDGRPDYPSRVYEVLRSRCAVGPGSKVLEIGPGPGMVTRHLLAAGAWVVAVEPDPGFAQYLAHTLPGVQVVTAPFEQADLEGGFDAVVAATSFHWLDQPAALSKLGRVLRPGGWAAIWWSLFSDPHRDDPLLTAATAALGFEPGNQRGGTGFQLDTEARCDDLRRGAGLVDIEYELIPSDIAMSADQVRALFHSMITIQRLPAGQRTHVLNTLTGLVNNAYGGMTTRPHLTALYFGRKAHGSTTGHED